MSKIEIAEYISELLIHHIIPCWIFFGFLSVLLFCILLKVEKENIVEIFKEEVELKDICLAIIWGPVSVILMMQDYKDYRYDKKIKKRKTCGWWELKEYGGKY